MQMLSTEYTTMMSTILDEIDGMRPTDLVKMGLPGYPFDENGLQVCTNGDTYLDSEGNEQPLETVLTCEGDRGLRQLVDYMILYQKPQAAIKWVDKSTRIEKFAVEGKPYAFVSDHYGLSSQFTLA